MKKLLKLSLLVAILFLALTIRSYAAEVQYGDLKSDGSMDVTITYQVDLPDEAVTDFHGRQYTVDTENKKMTRTFTDVNVRPKFDYLWWKNGDDDEEVTIATPYIMNIGQSLTITSDEPYRIQNSSDSSIVLVNGSTFTAQKAGQAELTLAGEADEKYKLKITVVGDSEPDSDTPADLDPIDSNITATCDDSNLIVSGLPSGGRYEYFVDSNPSTPYDSSIRLYGLTEKDSTYKSSLRLGKIQVELNKDYYIHIVDRSDSSNPKKIADVKLIKPDLSAYNKFSGLSFSAYDSSNLYLNLPYNLKDDDVTRKIHFKIGRITDTSILNSLKNNEASGFANLNNFAKKDTNAVFDKTVEANKYNGYSTQENLINYKDLTHNAYYYLYAELDTENGKYLPLESITITKAHVYPDSGKWFMFFYGSKDFNFDGIDDAVNPDNSENEEKPPVFPDTGEKTLIFSIIGVTAIVAIVLFKKNKITKIK